MSSAARERQISTTVLVIGTGGSGLRAAIEVAERGQARGVIAGSHLAFRGCGASAQGE